jgi:hypothetical protein
MGSLTTLFNWEKHGFDGISYSKYDYTVKNTVKFDGMSIEFMGTDRNRKPQNP